MAAALVAAATCALAQPAYPPRPVRLLVGFPPGGGTDFIARLIAPGLSDFFQQQFIVDNRPGAAGNIAAELAAGSPKDGCTLLVVSAAFSSNVSLYARAGYEPLRDFAAITRIASIHNVFVVHPSTPAKSIKELVALAKARPAELRFGSAGNGSVSHLAIELLKATVGGLNVLHVPYRGMAPAVIDLVGGEVHALVATLPVSVPHIRSGRLRALAVAGLKRAGPLPEIPTVDEDAFPGYEAAAWNAVLAPAGTSYDIVTRLNLAIIKVSQSREVRERLETLGADLVGDTPDQFTAYLRAEIAKWAKVVKKTGAKVE
ncbi:MAG TPA: tripartite tricarboxylate transporter substrate binding protein [Burkholderiales bacterium]|nr:tripartite tricarboxylate transporter substrate binding protein [Burkholderiales bacterium]